MTDTCRGQRFSGARRRISSSATRTPTVSPKTPAGANLRGSTPTLATPPTGTLWNGTTAGQAARNQLRSVIPSLSAVVPNAANYVPGVKPFTAQWYATHPNAWKALHPHANAWTVAGAASVTAWVRLNNGPITQSYATVGSSSGNSYAEQNLEQATALAGKEQPSVEQFNPENWMPLGVYALTFTGQTEATSVMQVSISKEGLLTGSYYDMLSDGTHILQGAVDQKNQRAGWRVGSSNGTVFETTLGNLTQDQSPVLLHFPGGGTKKWSLVRLQQ